MFPARHEEKRKRAAAIAIEPLEERVALTAGVASLEIQYLRAITHLNGMLQRRVNQIQTVLTRRSARVDAQYESALNRAAARLGGGGPAQARTSQAALSRATAAADSRINQVVADVNGKLGGFTAAFNRRLADVTGHYGALNSTIRSANPYFQANFRNALSAVDRGIAGEARSEQETLDGAIGPAQSAVAQAGTAGASAQAQAEAAAGHLAGAGEAQRAADRAAVAQFWDRYYSSFNPLRAEMAAIASAQLPPVHLGGGRVTGPQGHRTGNNRGINGTGTGTVTFTGLPGGDATSGSGFGSATGVSGTAGTGTGNGTTTITGNGPGVTGVGTGTIGTGTTGIGTTGVGSTGTGTTGVGTGTTGTGTGTTGVGSTVTAGNGANGNGVGSTTGTAGGMAAGSAGATGGTSMI